MLTEYVERAMRKAQYELMENGQFFATIPNCKGLWAQAKSLEKCHQEPRSTLKDWLLLGLQLDHHLPVIDGINLKFGRRFILHRRH